MNNHEQRHNNPNNPQLYGFDVEPGCPDLNHFLRLGVKAQDLVDDLDDLRLEMGYDIIQALQCACAASKRQTTKRRFRDWFFNKRKN